MVRIGQMSAELITKENNPGGTYHVAKFVVTGKNGKKAAQEIRWLMNPEGKIVGTSIKITGKKGFGELLAILAAFQKAQEAPSKNS